MNATTKGARSFTDDIREMMTAFDTMRVQWIEKFGVDEGFNEWFTVQVLR